MRRLYSVLLLCLTAAGCSEVNAPDDVVESVEICRDCGDGFSVIPSYENGRTPYPGIAPFVDGDCSTWELPDVQGHDLTGSDTLFLAYILTDGTDSIRRGVSVPLDRKSYALPCP